MPSFPFVGLYEKARDQVQTRLGAVILSCAIVPWLLVFACAPTPSLAGFAEGRAAYDAKDYKSAYEDLRKAADEGHAGAQYYLGHLYRRGRGVERDHVKAVQWYRMAADQGHANAQYRLGVMYQEQQGVKRDYAEAARWYRKAADQDHALAQYNLGMLFKNGRGVQQNNVEAYMWFTLFAAQRPKDQRNWVLGNMEEYMAQMEIVEAKERAKNSRPSSSK